MASVQVTTGRQSATVMRDILVSHGCPESAVFVEREGGNTIEQAHNVAAMLRDANVKIIKLVRSHQRCTTTSFQLLSPGTITTTRYGR